MTDVNLKYLFRALLADGGTVEQGERDESEYEIGKSRFYDVVNAGSPVIGFILAGCGHEYGLDLTTGCFSIDGVPFRFHGAQHGLIRNVELQFWRHHEHDMLVSIRNGEESHGESEHRIIYCFGFKGVDANGEPFERMMEIE